MAHANFTVNKGSAIGSFYVKIEHM